MSDKSPLQRSREHCFVIADQFRLTKGERLELASYVLGQEVDSFSSLGPFELARMVDAFEGARYLAQLKNDHRTGQRS